MLNKFDALRKDFEKSVARLDEVLQRSGGDEIVRDSAIKRFEICFDLAWKTLRMFLHKEKGVVCNSPKDCFREAYRQQIIQYDDFWLALTELRNLTAHTYNQELAQKVYVALPESLLRFRQLQEVMMEKK